jgi:hypothetical protein
MTQRDDVAVKYEGIFVAADVDARKIKARRVDSFGEACGQDARVSHCRA